MTSKIVLETRNLTKIYYSGLFRKRSVLAVDNVSFNLRKGEIISLVGESGSGKTTVARMVLRLLPPTSGKILYRGEDISQLKKKQELREYQRYVQKIFEDPRALFRLLHKVEGMGRVIPDLFTKRFSREKERDYWRHVQGIFQDPYAPFNLFYKVDRVFNMVFNLFKQQFSKEKKRKMIDSSLKMVDLNPEEVLGKYPHQLSGGQRQRILIARSLIVNPEILLADEPTSMIDASTRVDVLKVFSNLKEKQGLSIIFITHDLGLAYYISDRMLVMQKGQIVEEGEVGEIISNPKSEYTEKLLSSIPTLSKKWESTENVGTS